MTLIQLFVIGLLIATFSNVFKFARDRRSVKSYNLMVILVLWTLPGVYILSK